MRSVFLLIVALALSVGAIAQQESQRIFSIEQRVSVLERRMRDAGKTGVALFLFGGFCALWAQNTGRNSWLWFFLGFFFSIITVIVLLVKNSEDLDSKRRE